MVVWICFGVFGNHGSQPSGSSDRGSIEMGSGVVGPDVPADGQDASALLPVATDVEALPATVQQFRVEVATQGGEVTVSTSTKLNVDDAVVTGSWTGDVTPGAGYTAPAANAGEQSTKGPLGPTVSGIVTATSADSTSTVQCRVYADDVLVLMSTGPGTVTCRVPAVDGNGG